MRLHEDYDGNDISIPLNERVGYIWINGVRKDLNASYAGSYVYGGLKNEINAYVQATGDYPMTEQELQNSQYFSLYWVGLHQLGNKITIHQNGTPKRIDGINIFDTIG